MTTTSLRITEIFLSIQGESRSVGWPTAFIRLTGCPLRCAYCDTAYAFSGGQVLCIEEIQTQVRALGARFVTVTGGEPLAQPNCLTLLRVLCDQGYEVSLETSGALDVSEVDRRVSRVVDIKTPGSGESSRNLWSNLPHLGALDQVKFVICNRDDYEWSRDVLTHHRLAETVPEILFSPSYQALDARTLADWIVQDRLPVRLQLQLHKILWGDVPGR